MENPVFESSIDENLKRQQAEKYPLALPLGTILNGRFLIQRVLGQGGFGITYLAWDLVDHVAAAVKEYMPQNLAGRTAGNAQMTLYQGDLRDQYDKGMRDFLKEAKVLATFNGDPHIVGARRFFEENGTAYLVMEYVQGQSLKQYIKDQGGRIPWEEALRIMIPVMEALESVHQAGILHRDVAPDNIYITPEGGVKLLDFGAARSAMGNRNQSMTVMLKAGYTPLEQYTRNGKQGPYSDVYSVAATLYGAITSYLPPDAVDRIEEDHLVPISTLGISVPKQLEDAILKGLSVSYSKRFQTMGEFKNAVIDLLPQQETRTEESWLCSCGTLNTGRFCSECGAPRPGSGPDPQELERKRQEELNRQRELERQQEQQRQEALNRQREQELAHQQELDRQMELKRQQDLLMQQELRRQAEQQKAQQAQKPAKSGKGKWIGIGAAAVAAVVLVGALASGNEKEDLPASSNRPVVSYTEPARKELEPEKQENVSEEVWELILQARNGDAEAQFQVACAYDEGDGAPLDYDRAFYWAEQAALQGHGGGETKVGYYCVNGLGTEEDIEEAYSWFRKSADHGDPVGQYNLGLCYLHGWGTEENEPEAVKWLQASADQDWMDAITKLGNCYYYGWGVDMNDPKAVELYTKASDMGSAEAQNQLGLCYDFGHGVAENDAKAAELYRLSAEQGYAEGQANLGDCLYFGWGVPEDPVEGVSWYQKSADQGESDGMIGVGRALLWGNGITQDTELGIKYLEAAAAQDDSFAYYLLGDAYRYGQAGIPVDLEKAKDYYRSAAELGFDPAQDALNEMG